MNFGDFRRILEYKAKWYNRKIVFVDRFYPSSKTCHNCGYVNKGLKLSDRQWICPQCGEVIERDYNAALNILDEGLRILETTINVGCCTPELTLAADGDIGSTKLGGNYPTMDDRLSNGVLKSSGRLKQEVNKARSSTLCKF